MSFPATLLRLLCLALLLAGALSSCRSANQLLKAKAAPLSPFLEHRQQMKPNRERVPFHKAWSNPDDRARQRVMDKREIFIAPVTLRYLRPLKKPLVQREVAMGSIERREPFMAATLRTDFATAFSQSPAPRYLLAQRPNASSVTLELALVELNPTSPKGNAVKTAMKFVVGPLAGLGGYFTKGNVAIEGKIRNSATGELIFEFADNEADRMTFYSLRDFQAYGHAFHAFKAWGQQFEEFTRTRPGHRIDDTLCFTLDPR